MAISRLRGRVLKPVDRCDAGTGHGVGCESGVLVSRLQHEGCYGSMTDTGTALATILK